MCFTSASPIKTMEPLSEKEILEPFSLLTFLIRGYLAVYSSFLFLYLIKDVLKRILISNKASFRGEETF